jgi:PUA domain protein
MPRKYRRCFLRQKEAKIIFNEASEKLKMNINQFFKGKVSMEMIETDFGEIFIVGNRALLFRTKGKIFPSLLFKEIFVETPKAFVDLGAVPHICKGANVMAPGIVRFEGKFEKNDVVFVVDVKYEKKIAVGEAKYDAEYAKKVVKGAIITNIHFVGDKIWNFIKKI